MAAKGAHVVLAARDPESLDAAFSEITTLNPQARVETMLCDLAAIASVRECGAQAAERLGKIDILINNAGVMACPFMHTADGFEVQFGTNHLGHFALSAQLMELVLKAADANGAARIINLSSRGHHIAPADLEDPNFEAKEYNEWLSYGQSKTANVLFTVGLDARFADQGVEAFAVHPGGIETNLARHLSDEQNAALRQRIYSADPDFTFKSVPQGAATQCWAATAPALEGRGGLYCEDCHVADVDDESPTSGVRSYALDKEAADRLWSLSEELTGVQFAA